MDYLVTGGAGFIGSNTVQRLVADGASVRVVDDLSSGRPANLEPVRAAIEWLEGDIADAETARAAAREVKHVLHFAARPSVPGSVAAPLSAHHANAWGTLNLLVAARDAGVERFVFSSSSAVYGDTDVLPVHEDLPTHPVSPYGVQKLTGEHYCRVFRELYGLPAFSLRYFNVFGPNQDPASQYSAVIPLFVTAMLEGRPPVIFGDGEQTRDFTFVTDIVEANLCCCRAAEDAAGAVYNVACGDRISVNGMAATLRRVLGSDVMPRHEEPRAGDIRHSQADAGRAKARLGWTPQVTFAEGIGRTVDYYRALAEERRTA